MGVWMCSVDQQSRELFFNSDLQQWIKLNITGVISGIGIENWWSFWAIACHSIWKWYITRKRMIEALTVLTTRML
jgi:hypothetical protein